MNWYVGTDKGKIKGFVGKLDEMRIDTVVRTEAEKLDWYHCDAAFKDQYSFNNRDSSTVINETGGILAESISVTNGIFTVPDIKTASYLLTANDYWIIFNSAGAVTATLPAATGTGRNYIIGNVGAGVVTIDGNGSETIEGSTTQYLVQYESLHLVDYVTGAWKVG